MQESVDGSGTRFEDVFLCALFDVELYESDTCHSTSWAFQPENFCFQDRGFPEIRGTFFGVPRIRSSILESPYFVWKLRLVSGPEAARADEEVAQTGGSPTTLESLEQEAEMSQRPSKMLLYEAFTGQRTKEVDRGLEILSLRFRILGLG